MQNVSKETKLEIFLKTQPDANGDLNINRSLSVNLIESEICIMDYGFWDADN